VATENTPTFPKPITTKIPEIKLSKKPLIPSLSEIVEEEMVIDQPVTEKILPEECPIDCLNCGS